jgi:hypothetical protein
MKTIKKNDSSTTTNNPELETLSESDLLSVAGGYNKGYSGGQSWRRQHITRRWNWVKGFFGA